MPKLSIGQMPRIDKATSDKMQQGIQQMHKNLLAYLQDGNVADSATIYTLLTYSTEQLLCYCLEVSSDLNAYNALQLFVAGLILAIRSDGKAGTRDEVLEYAQQVYSILVERGSRYGSLVLQELGTTYTGVLIRAKLLRVIDAFDRDGGLLLDECRDIAGYAVIHAYIDTKIWRDGNGCNDKDRRTGFDRRGLSRGW